MKRKRFLFFSLIAGGGFFWFALTEATTCWLIASIDHGSLKDVFLRLETVSWIPGSISKAEKLLLSRLKSRDPYVRWKAFKALQIGDVEGGKVLASLLPLLHDEDCGVRWDAAYFIGELNSSIAVIAIPDLIATIENETSSTSPNLRVGRGGYAPPYAASLSSGTIRSAAIEAIGKIGRPAIASHDILMKYLTDEDAVLRLHSAVALWRVTEKSELVVPVLVQLLQEKDAKWGSVSVLKEVGVVAKESIPHIIAQIAMDDVVGNLNLLQAVDSIDPQGANATGVVLILSALKNRFIFDKEHAEIAVPIMIKIIEDEAFPPYVRLVAAQILGEYGEEAKNAIPALRKAIDDKNMSVRLASTHALRKVLRHIK